MIPYIFSSFLLWSLTWEEAISKKEILQYGALKYCNLISKIHCFGTNNQVKEVQEKKEKGEILKITEGKFVWKEIRN